MKGIKKMKSKLELKRIALLSVLISSSIYATAPQPQQKRPVSREEVNQLLQNPKQLLMAAKHLILNRKKVGIRLEQVNRMMAKIIDSNAEFDTTTIREAEQEISDRVRQAIEKFEEQHDVCVVVYHESKKGIENVTELFIKETFPYADTNIKQPQQSTSATRKDK